MARVKRGVVANRRHKKVLKQAKGYYGARSRIYRVAVQAVTKAGTGWHRILFCPDVAQKQVILVGIVHT